MSPIYVVDPLWTGVKHAGFNSAFLAVLEHAFPDAEVYFYAESSHIHSVRHKLVNIQGRISFKRLYLPYQDKKYKIPFLYLVSFLQSVRALTNFSGKGLLIFSGMNSLVLAPLYLLNLILAKKCVMVVHGELAFLDRDVSRNLNFHYKLQAFIFRKIFKKALVSRSIYFIVLGDFIYQSLKIYIPESLLQKKVAIMEHPYIFAGKPVRQEISNHHKLSLAIVGLATKAKGADRILDLERALNRKNIADKVKLSIIGKVVDFHEELNHSNISYYSNSSFIKQAQYDRLIDEQDFILFFYPDNTYRLTASGAFLDCVLHGKPVIAIRNEFFSYYSAKVGGIGFLVETIEEMADCIDNLLNRSDECMGSEQFQGMEKIRSLFVPETVAESLRVELAQKGIIKS